MVVYIFICGGGDCMRYIHTYYYIYIVMNIKPYYIKPKTENNIVVPKIDVSIHNVLYIRIQHEDNSRYSVCTRSIA